MDKKNAGVVWKEGDAKLGLGFSSDSEHHASFAAGRFASKLDDSASCVTAKCLRIYHEDEHEAK